MPERVLVKSLYPGMKDEELNSKRRGQLVAVKAELSYAK